MSYMVDKMPYGGYALGGYALGGEIYGGAKARAAKAKKPAVAKKNKKLVHQGYEVKVKIADLKSQAKALGIKGYSKMRKFELLKAVREHNKPLHMVEVEHKPKKQVKRSAKKTVNDKKNLSDRQCLEILKIADVLKMKLAELKKNMGLGQ